MHWCIAFGSRHRRRRHGHTRLLTPLWLTLTLVACATHPTPNLQLVDQATAMLGQPYRWGGAAPGGFDCSGLVSYAAAGAGISLPRTTHAQQRVGIAIRRADLQAGDLVFMHLERKELHVGIALDQRRFIHAPSTGKSVRIDWLDAPPYATAFIEARRIVRDR